MVSGVVQDPLVGQVLSGRYRILTKLGEGAMAGVYLAEHTGVGATIVLKVLLPALANEPQFVDSFLREARIAAEIQHDNVIDIFYSGRSPEGFVYLAMEYVKGATLYDVLEKEGPLPWARAQPLLVEIAGALAAAHKMGVVHRDVKPENVLVGRKEGPAGAVEYVKVVDFGISNARGDIGGAEGVCGTPEFMPPEQAQGQEPDARDDVYAFGCLMYQVLTGDVPFRADDVPRVLLMHLRDPVQPPRQRRPDLAIPGGAQEVVMRALEKKRADRWQDMAEIASLLAAVELAPEPEPLPEEPPPPAPKRTLSAGPSLRARAVLPREAPRWRAQLPLAVGVTLGVGACIVAFARHQMLHAPGKIEIATDPLDAQIYIDGQKMADRSPMVLEASPGAYTVIVRSAGFEPLAARLQMRPHADEHVVLTLTALPQPPPPRAPPAHHQGVAVAGAGVAPARRKPAAPVATGVTFIDFKKAAAEQKGR
jgi:tRNA A-37 threonylcarbamoyl transferase component Bud32